MEQQKKCWSNFLIHVSHIGFFLQDGTRLGEINVSDHGDWIGTGQKSEFPLPKIWCLDGNFPEISPVVVP